MLTTKMASVKMVSRVFSECLAKLKEVMRESSERSAAGAAGNHKEFPQFYSGHFTLNLPSESSQRRVNPGYRTLKSHAHRITNGSNRCIPAFEARIAPTHNEWQLSIFRGLRRMAAPGFLHRRLRALTRNRQCMGHQAAFWRNLPLTMQKSWGSNQSRRDADRGFQYFLA
jgi:hypothetical protein